jgi:hypothetical protein
VQGTTKVVAALEAEIKRLEESLATVNKRLGDQDAAVTQYKQCMEAAVTSGAALRAHPLQAHACMQTGAASIVTGRIAAVSRGPVQYSHWRFAGSHVMPPPATLTLPMIVPAPTACAVPCRLRRQVPARPCP